MKEGRKEGRKDQISRQRGGSKEKRRRRRKEKLKKCKNG